jgi:hypothetical protein
MILFETDKRPVTFLLDLLDQETSRSPTSNEASCGMRTPHRELSLNFQAEGVSAAEADPAVSALLGVVVS